MSSRKLQSTTKMKIPPDLKETQDRRLTSKHIHTLMKLDDVEVENEKLKSKIDLLEKEFSSCSHVHDFARLAKQKLDDLESDCNEKISVLKLQNAEKVLEKEQELQFLLSENERKWKMNQEWLKDEVKELEKKVFCHGEEKKAMLQKIETQNKSLIELETLTSMYQNMENEVSLFENRCKEYKKEEEECKNRNIELTSLVEVLEKQVTTLSAELEQTKEQSSRLANKNILLTEIEQLTSDIDILSTEKDHDSSTLEELKSRNTELTNMLAEMQKKLKLVIIERDAISQSSSDLSLELTHLKETFSNHNVSSVASREDFVTENKKLKQHIRLSSTDQKSVRSTSGKGNMSRTAHK